MKTIIKILIILLSLSFCTVNIYAYEPEDYLSKDIKYYYEELTELEQEIYDNILTGIVNFDAEIEINCNSDRLLYEILMKLRTDFPEIFWVAEEYSYKSTDEKIISIMLNYVYNKEEIDEINKIIDDTILELKEKTKNLSDYEKAREVFDYTCEKITYNSNTFNSINVEQAFIKGDAICGGFAKMYAILANGLELPCKMVIGCRIPEAKVGHSWNEVYIEDKIIYVDCTWGDHTQERNEENTYFDTKKEIFKKNHIELIL